MRWAAEQKRRLLGETTRLEASVLELRARCQQKDKLERQVTEIRAREREQQQLQSSARHARISRTHRNG